MSTQSPGGAWAVIGFLLILLITLSVLWKKEHARANAAGSSAEVKRALQVSFNVGRSAGQKETYALFQPLIEAATDGVVTPQEFAAFEANMQKMATNAGF